MTSNSYTKREAHILRSMMSSIHERHVPSQEKPTSMNHKFPNMTRERNNIETKIISRYIYHISLATFFPTSQNFCNSDTIWESYAIFRESLQSSKMSRNCSSKKFHTFSPNRCNKRETWLMIKWMFFLLFIHFIVI